MSRVGGVSARPNVTNGRARRRRVALVTGGTRGLGEAIAVGLATAGMDVAITGRDAGAGERVRRRLTSASSRGVLILCDVTVPGAMDAAVTRCVDELGGMDVAVNNAGVAAAGLILEQNEDDWVRALETNLTGVWRSLRAELRVMVPQGFGSVINVGSIWGLRGRAGMSAYSATKHAILGLTKSVALEVAAKGVRVNAVCPGTADTEMVRGLGRTDEELTALAAKYPFGRLATGGDVAGVVRWLASDDAAYVSGAAIVVDGGFSV